MAAVLPGLLAVLLSALIAAESIGAPMSGATLRVGPQHELKSSSAAAKVRRDRDTYGTGTSIARPACHDISRAPAQDRA